MTAKWQQWVPFHIDRFLGSAAVQAMDPACKMGYWLLLCRQWQSDDCTISSDPFSLAQDSGLGDELWAQYGPRILRNFVSIDKKLRNLVAFDEWNEAKRVFEARRVAANRTNTSRSPHGHRTVTDEIPQRSAYTITGTRTVTDTKVQKPSRGKRERRVTKTSIADERHTAFKDAIKRYWDAKNPGIDMPWDGREGKALGMWLSAAPHITLDQFTEFLRNRFKSAVNHGDRVSCWIASITSYGSGPMDRFGKTIHQEENNGTTYRSPAKERVDGNRRAIAEALAARGVTGPWSGPRTDGETIPESGFDGRATGVHGGPGEVSPEILPPESGGRDSGTPR